MTTTTAPAVEDFLDYYNILGLTKAASEADVKKSYRKLAMKWHPDKNANNGEEAAKKFQEIAEAYDVLTSKEKRAIYDQFGYEGLRDGVVDNHGVTRSGYGKPDAQEVFENFFGTKNPFADFGFNDATPFGSKLKKPGPKKADPVVQDLPLTLEELFNGCTKRLAITRQKFTPEGQLVDSTKVLTINVKPGWKKGTKVTFPCEGDEGPNVIPADVIFVITEKPHDHFVREGTNLVFTAKILLVDAITDCYIEVPTLDGRKLSLPCPEVVSPGYETVIHGEGMPLSKQPDNRGDLVIRFNIIFPKYISEEKKSKIRNLLAHPEKMN